MPNEANEYPSHPYACGCAGCRIGGNDSPRPEWIEVDRGSSWHDVLPGLAAGVMLALVAILVVFAALAVGFTWESRP